MTITIFLLSLIGSMAIGVPIAYALMFSGVVLMWHLDLFNAQILAQNLIHGADSFPLLAVPFFMLAGELMNSGGLSKRIVSLALLLVGHRRGGLGYVTIVAGCLLAAMSGSAVADAAALTALLLPMMVRAGHDRRHAGGLIASTGIIAPVIPPSIAMIVYGVVANVSITQLFLGGIVPGLLMATSIAFAWWWIARGEDTQVAPRASGREKLLALRESGWALMLPVIVLVGLRFGVFTPTEAAVVAAVYAFFVSTVIYRQMTLRELYEAMARSALSTSVVMFMVAAATVAAWLITIAEIPGAMIALLQPLMDSPTLLLVAILVLIFAIGTAMDITPTILIMAPILSPVVRAAGIDPVYFGILFVMTTALSLITPPVGVVLNTVAGVARMKFDAVARGVLPFLLAEIGVLALLVVFPSLILIPLRWLTGG